MQTILTKIQVQDDRMLITDNEETIFNKFNFSLRSVDELNAVEEHLMDETNTNMFVRIIYMNKQGIKIKLYYVYMFLLMNNFR